MHDTNMRKHATLIYVSMPHFTLIFYTSYVRAKICTDFILFVVLQTFISAYFSTPTGTNITRFLVFFFLNKPRIIDILALYFPESYN